MHITFGGWLIYLVVVAIITLLGLWFRYENCKKGVKTTAICVIIIVGLSVLVLLAFNWFYTHTATGNRAFKTQQSEFNNGIDRVVTVYDINGKVIKTYEGKFDVQHDGSRILFDDENGLRHIIYYPTGTVIIDEIDK